MCTSECDLTTGTLAHPRQKSVEIKCNLIDAPPLQFIPHELSPVQHTGIEPDLQSTTMCPDDSFTDVDLHTSFCLSKEDYTRVSLHNDMISTCDYMLY